MFNDFLKRTVAVSALLSGMMLSSCASKDPIILDSKAHISEIEKSLNVLYPDMVVSETPMELTLSQAINRSLRYNLDARVAAIETLIAQDNVSLAQFEGAPNISGSAGVVKRNNTDAASADSITTGAETLETSTSSDRIRRLADVKVQWNILDSVIAYLEGKNAQDDVVIAKERLRKVQHGLESDIVRSYWSAYTGQELESKISILSKDIAKIEKSIQQARDENLLSPQETYNKNSILLDAQGRLNELYEITSISKMELKEASAIPMDQDVILKTRPSDLNNKIQKTLKNKTINNFVNLALQKRPELREQFMVTNMSARGIERELIKTFPGMNLVYSLNKDSNDYLAYDKWNNATATLSQSLTDFISLPTRYRAAKNRDMLENNRRMAVVATIVAQVHMAKMQINLAEAHYNMVRSEYEMLEKHAQSTSIQHEIGNISKYENILSEINIIAKNIEMQQAYARVQQAYIDMIGTMGLSLSEFTNTEML